VLFHARLSESGVWVWLTEICRAQDNFTVQNFPNSLFYFTIISQAAAVPRQLALLALSCTLRECEYIPTIKSLLPSKCIPDYVSPRDRAAAHASSNLPSRYPPFSPGSKDAVVQMSNAMELNSLVRCKEEESHDLYVRKETKLTLLPGAMFHDWELVEENDTTVHFVGRMW
jgi:hypothetical protein